MVLWTECCDHPPPQSLSVESICWNIIPIGIVFGGWAFGRCSDHKRGALVNGISAPIRRDQRVSSHFFFSCKATRKSQPFKTWKRALTRTQPCQRYDLGIYKTLRNQFLLLRNHLVYIILFKQPELRHMASSDLGGSKEEAAVPFMISSPKLYNVTFCLLDTSH